LDIRERNPKLFERILGSRVGILISVAVPVGRGEPARLKGESILPNPKWCLVGDEADSIDVPTIDLNGIENQWLQLPVRSPPLKPTDLAGEIRIV
jgi:hypothetical protein